MACLDCGCDAWFEQKYGMKITAKCSCSCHKPTLWDKIDDNPVQVNESHPIIKKNRINGKLASIYSQHDLIDNGFSLWWTGGRGFDFIAASSVMSADWPGLWYFVEVKYNKSRLSRLQKLTQRYCKRNHINYFVYRVTPDQLRFWLIKRGGLF